MHWHSLLFYPQLLSVITQEISQFLSSLVQNFNSGQIYNSEVVGLLQVETLTGNQQNLLIPQQIKGELLVVGDVKLLGVDLGEDVEAGLGLYRADTGDIVQCLGDELCLLIHAAAGDDVVLDTLIAAQCGLHDGLGRHIGAKTHVGEHVETFDIVSAQTHIAADNHPANAETCDHVGLGKTGEGDAEQIGGQGRNGDMLLTGENQAVIDLVGEDHQVVLSGQLYDLQQHILGVQRTGGVVGVNDNDCLGLGSNLAAHIVDVRIPLRLLVTNVVHSLAASQGNAGSP